MANYIASARSNYFHVKDSQVFEKFLADVGGLGHWTDAEGRYAIFTNDGDSGSWPSFVQTEEEDFVDFDLTEELPQFLVEGQVAVLIEVGAEKLRYLVGHAVAIHSSGRITEISLDDIYVQAREEFDLADGEPSQASY